MTHKIKTYEAACKALKLNPKNIPVVSNIPKKHKDAIVAHYKLVIIAEAINEGWTPDWADYNQYKYYPWFEMKKAGAGFSIVCSGWVDYSSFGSRLCYKSRELAEYAGKQFEKLYNTYMTLPK